MLKTAYEICENSSKLRFAGYVADRPSPLEKNPRYTMYPEFFMYPELLRIQAESLGVPMYRDKINGSHLTDAQGFSAFQRWLYDEALDRKIGDKKDLNIIFLMACFGPRVTRPTIDLARGWFFNSHPNIVGTHWGPTNPYKGAQPYEQMLLARRELEEEHGEFPDFCCELVAHPIDNKYDNGMRAFGVGKVRMPPYHGKITYERWTPSCQKMVTCRPRDQGKWIHDMHRRMMPATERLTEKILTNRKIIQSILDGKWATRKRIMSIFDDPPRISEVRSFLA
jgi:hypothetical protein